MNNDQLGWTVKVEQLNAMIIAGDTLRAIQQFYGNDVIVQENEESPRVGKKICLENEKLNLSRVAHVQSKLINQAIDTRKNVVFSEWKILFTNLQGITSQLTEVSVQQWRDGLIIHEKFYYQKSQPID
ncbi:hypothetical protein [Tunicatimonas pelagia]|uniref:hypothetical protein n=1 Tax=Tunicatimonas pelagia TaxID=931531 RepID=UPI002665979B|nr:hypothetical protein [Tunicatimonas pelagia]WKN44106.1 hypothetical protein P0M28_03885 [Tunicatimonas pelagia]